jgi:hypothetical protein
MRKSVFAGVVVWVFFWLLPSSFSQITTGTISGTVTDVSGGAIPGAQVVVLNEETGVARTVFSNAVGRYSAPQLSLGRFRVTATNEGFQAEARTGIVLTVGREAVVNFQLQVGQVTQTVEVSGEAPLVETSDAAVGYLVEERSIRELPLNGRDISELILLNPNVVINANGKWGNADKGFGKRYSISGMRGEDNSYLLDGTYINDYYRHHPAGPTGALAGVETVKEFETLTSTFSAAYGRALGGVFNAVTQSGTNQWHGTAYEFLRNDIFDALNFFDRQATADSPRLPPYRRNQFGATFGGRVIRDRTFFFAAYEGFRERLGESITSNVPDLNARNGVLPGGTVTISPLIAPFLATYPLPSPDGENFGNGTQEYFFQVSQPTSENFGQGRIDHQFSDNDSIFLRTTINNAERFRQNEFPDLFESGTIKTRLWTVSETKIFSPTWLNTVRFSYNRIVPGTDHIFPGATPQTVSIAGWPDPAGIEPGSGISVRSGTENPKSGYETKRFAFHDDVNTTRGNHTIQFGGMFERLHYNPFVPFRPYGEWRFADISEFLQGVPDRFRGTPAELANFQRGIRQSFMALYLQDDWKVTPSVSLNLGVRWEPFTIPTEVNGLIDNLRHTGDAAPTIGDPLWQNSSWDDFSPRVGVAWSPFASGRTSIRAGVGVFFVPIDSSYYTLVFGRSTNFSPAIEIDDPLHFPDALAAVAANSAAGDLDAYSLPFEDPDTAHALQYSLTIQQQLGEANVLSVGYSGRSGINLPSNTQFNIPVAQFDGVSLRIPSGAEPINPNFGSINYISNNANSSYHGLGIGLQRRFSAGLQAQISYTYSKAISNTDGADTGNHVGVGNNGAILYGHDISTNKALSGYDLRNVFTASYTYDLPFGQGMGGAAGMLLSGWQVSGITTFQSGQPFGVLQQAPNVVRDYGSRSWPIRNPGFTQENTVSGDPNGFFTLDAFSPAGTGNLGNAGRNGLFGDGIARWDFGVHKNFPLTETMRLQLRVEAFNLFNNVNFAAPSQTGTAGGNVQIFTRRGDPVISETRVTQTVNTSRQIQFGMKLAF